MWERTKDGGDAKNSFHYLANEVMSITNKVIYLKSNGFKGLSGCSPLLRRKLRWYGYYSLVDLRKTRRTRKSI